jgi:3-deoxy-7-phosphoheptulonate synthase
MPVDQERIDGSIEVARDAIAAAHPHILGIDAGAAVVATAGNPDRHLCAERGGSAAPTTPPATARRDRGARHARRAGRPLHANSGKDHRCRVCRAVLEQVRAGQPALLGVALESHLAGPPGVETGHAARVGVSITDACIGWDENARCWKKLQTRLPAVARDERIERPAPARGESPRYCRSRPRGGAWQPIPRR